MQQSSTEILGLDEPCADLGQFGALDLHHLVLERRRNLSSIFAILFWRWRWRRSKDNVGVGLARNLHPQERRMKGLLDAAFAGLTNLVRCRENNRLYVVKWSTRESVQCAPRNQPFSE